MTAPGRNGAASISLLDLLRIFPEEGSTGFFMAVSSTKAAGEAVGEAIVACVGG